MPTIAVGQICSTADLDHNLLQCLTLVDKASKAGAKALFLPEASDYIAIDAKESLSLALPTSGSPFVQGLQTAARIHGIAINVGVHEPTEDKKKAKNLLLWIDENGDIIRTYQKVHLFDVDIEGGPKLKESDSVEPGQTLSVPFQTAVGIIGMLICFDLRFPEPSTRLTQTTSPLVPSATLLTYPSAFTVPTGRAHWSTLLRARAIETQAYVVAAAQVGAHNERRRSYGHSMVVGPWGDVLVELGGGEERLATDEDGGGDDDDGKGGGGGKVEEANRGPELGVCEVSEEVVARIRKEMPLVRRWDAYGRC